MIIINIANIKQRITVIEKNKLSNEHFDLVNMCS